MDLYGLGFIPERSSSIWISRRSSLAGFGRSVTEHLEASELSSDPCKGSHPPRDLIFSSFVYLI